MDIHTIQRDLTYKIFYFYFFSKCKFFISILLYIISHVTLRISHNGFISTKKKTNDLL